MCVVKFATFTAKSDLLYIVGLWLEGIKFGKLKYLNSSKVKEETVLFFKTYVYYFFLPCFFKSGVLFCSGLLICSRAVPMPEWYAKQSKSKRKVNATEECKLV